MDTASFQFLGFGLTVAIISNFSRSRAWRSIVLMLASIVFVGVLARSPVVLLPLMAFLLAGYAGLVLITRGVPRSAGVVIVFTIAAYIWLKKYTFLPESTFLRFPYFTLGLSYIFFRVLQLLIEARDKTNKEHIGLGAYLIYTLNFTTLVSGPIQRYEEFAQDQFAESPISLGARVIGAQLERIVRGFFKVNALATLFNIARVDALTELSYPVPPSAKLFAAFRVAVMYPLFLYANFSGYIDIVIALTRLMRVRLPENFDRPFSASSVMDFWNRWHITLSAWLKTYVYNPLLLALMRRVSSLALQPLLGVLCFFVTFFLVGVWHGRTSEFIVFGVMTGGGISVNRLWQLGLTRSLGRKSYKTLAMNPIYVSFARGLNYAWFAFTLLWFWASWKEIDRIFTSIGIVQWLVVWLAVWLSATVVLAIWEWVRSVALSVRTSGGPVLASRYARIVFATALGVTAFVMTVLLNQPAPDIVYKTF